MSDAKVLFNVFEDEKLVEMVSKFPCIYDTASLVYKDQSAKDIAWKEIGEFVYRSAQDCKKRWRNIKDTYLKRQKKRKSLGISDSSKGKKWPLADRLTFLGSVDHKPKITSNIQYDHVTTREGDIEVNTAVRDANTPSTSRCANDTSKRKADRAVNSLRPASKRQRHQQNVLDLMEARRLERQNAIENMKQNRDDDVDLFFKSIAMSVKKLRPNLINEAKMRSLQMVFELEGRYMLPLDVPPAPALFPSTSSDMISPSVSVDNSNLSTDRDSCD